METGIIKYFHENGNLALEYTIKNNALSGKINRYHEDGSLKESFSVSPSGKVEEFEKFVQKQKPTPETEQPKPKVNNQKEPEKPKIEMIKSENNVNPNKICPEFGQRCEITKEEMIRKLIYYYQVKFTIIQSIVTFMMKNDGFCFNRLYQLLTGDFCLPPNYLEIIPLNISNKFKKLLEYVVYNTANKCANKRGYYRKMNAVKFGNKYHEYIQMIETNYLDTLMVLTDIIRRLRKDKEISITNLNMIGLKTKEALDNIYTICELYYLMAISISLEK
jgi:antitoxin component YwqK of YwqJK toxin-antitoxin module